MSLFGFRSKKIPAPAVPVAPPPDFVQVLIARRGRFPALSAAPDQSKAIARQLDVTLMKSGFKLSPAVGHMVATLITEGPGGHPDLPTFRLSRFEEGKPIRGTYGDWLMC